MQFQIEPDDLRPLVELAVTEAIKQLRADEARVDSSRLSYTEQEASAILGVKPHVLADAGRRGEVVGCRVGKKILYMRESLLAFLRRNQKRCCT